MSLSVEERAELDALKATVKQLQMQLAAKGVSVEPSAETPPGPFLEGPRTGDHIPKAKYGEYLPIQAPPTTVPDPQALEVKKAPGPFGKATPEQAFVDPQGRSFDEPLPPDSPSITPASGRV